MTRAARVTAAVAMAVLVIASGCPAGAVTTSRRPLPPSVAVRQEPDGVTLGDPAFVPLPGAHADFGRLGGAVYQIEMPRHWNHRLVLYMHGFEEFATQAQVTAPDIRGYLIGHGYAWAASSFSSTSLIPGRAADETAALWDLFARKHGRPTRTYVTGLSMGGLATHIAAERYANRYDGALALCGSAGQTPGLMGTADYFTAGAFVAGVTQADIDSAPHLSTIIDARILPALRDPQKHRQFESILLDLTGGPRAFAREGFELEEETNWRRTELATAARIAPNRETQYRLGPLSAVSSADFNRAAVRLPVDDASFRAFAAGSDITGQLRIPLLTLHTTGDGQVPIEQARILRRRVDAAGKGDLLVQRVVQDAGHCGFRNPEFEAGFEALVRWVEHGVKPEGTNVLRRDLRELDRTYDLAPRPGTRAANGVRGARQRAVVRGRVTLDGAPFDATYLGATVERDGLVTNCQYTLAPVHAGRYRVTVMADAESTGCGARGGKVLLWTYAQSRLLWSAESAPWPGAGRTARFDATFSTSAPAGAAPPTSGFVGEVYDAQGNQLAPGARVEAFVGRTRCGVASTRRTGSFSGYSLVVVGPSSIPGCAGGATLTFRVNGRRAVNPAVNEPGGQQTLDLILR